MRASIPTGRQKRVLASTGRGKEKLAPAVPAGLALAGVCYIGRVMMPLRSFASDNNAGIHPEILKAIALVNQGHVVGYGADPYTAIMVNTFREHFGEDAEVFVVFNGTGANTLSLQAMTKSYQAVICAASAHVYTDECGAPEKFTGCKLIPVATSDGKLTVEMVRHAYHGIGDEHHVPP